MKQFHKFSSNRCDWCDVELPPPHTPPDTETQGNATFERKPNFKFFNDISTRGNRRNLCLDCFNKLCAFEDKQPKMKWLNMRLEALHEQAMLEPNHLKSCPYCQQHKRKFRKYLRSQGKL